MPWDYTQAEYDKQGKADPCFRLERLINYGLGGEKLSRAELKVYLPLLNIPPERRIFLEFLLWNKPF